MMPWLLEVDSESPDVRRRGGFLVRICLALGAITLLFFLLIVLLFDEKIVRTALMTTPISMAYYGLAIMMARRGHVDVVGATIAMMMSAGVFVGLTQPNQYPPVLLVTSLTILIPALCSNRFYFLLTTAFNASGVVVLYFLSMMDERLLPSAQVTFLTYQHHQERCRL